MIDDLKINILVKINIFIFYKFKLNCEFQITIIDNCQNIKIHVRFIIKIYLQVRRIVKTKRLLILFFNFIIEILIIYYNTLLKDRNFLFKSELKYDFDYIDGIYTYIINTSMTFIQIKNIISIFINLSRHTQLKTIVEYIANNCYQILYKLVNLIICK